MAISPTVQQYQEGIGEEQAPITQESVFNQKFGDLAFTALNSKYPQLQGSVVTFKVLESSPESRTGLGVFFIQNGNEIVYIPVVLTEGKVVSVEMVYRKEDNSFMPLVKEEVDSIVAANAGTDPSIVKGAPVVENTRNLLQTLWRPPQSSTPIYAASTDTFHDLPNGAKEALTEYFKSNPENLGKIAEFYPVELLAEKLAKVTVPAAVIDPDDVVSVISIDQLTKEAAAALSEEEKEQAIEKGYVVKVSVDDSIEAMVYAKLPVEMVISLGVSEKRDNTPMWGTGQLLKITGKGFEAEDCVVVGNSVFTKNGLVESAGYSNPVISDSYGNTPHAVYNESNSIVIGAFSEGVSAQDLERIGATLPPDTSIENSGEYGCLRVFYSTRNGSYKEIYSDIGWEFPALYIDTIEKRNIDGDVSFRNERGNKSVAFIKGINKGYVQVDKDSFIFPSRSYVLFPKYDKEMYVGNLTALHKLIEINNTRLKLVNDGAGYTLVDKTQKKTASFNDEVSLVEHLVNNYKLNKEARDLLLSKNDILLFSKEGAFTANPAIETGGQLANNSQEILDPLGDAYNVDPTSMEAAMALEDPEMLDLGMLTSLSGSENVKTLLVDQIPQYIETIDQLGRTLLSFTANQADIEAHYGADQYSSLMDNIRKLFRTFGALIHELKSYVNMN